MGAVEEQTEAYFRKLDESLLPVDEKGKTSLAESHGTSSHETSLAGNAGPSPAQKVYVIGNSPYYQTMAAMAVESELHVGPSFNCAYDTYLPQAKGHIILIETHKGEPIVPKAVLEKYYPNAFAGISRPAKSIRIKGTTIVFLEFSEQLQSLSKLESSKGEETAGETKAAETRIGVIGVAIVLPPQPLAKMASNGRVRYGRCKLSPMFCPGRMPC